MVDYPLSPDQSDAWQDDDDPSQLSRRDRERLQHRHEILQAAERVFVRKGYSGATIEETSREAEFAVGTIYTFFESKENLYTEVIGHVAEEFFCIFKRQVASIEDPVAAIKALVELRLKHFDDHRGFLRIFFETVPANRCDSARGLPDCCRIWYERYLDEVNGIIRRGIEAGLFDSQEPLCLTLCVSGVINAFIGYWTRLDGTPPIMTQVESVTQIILRAVGCVSR